MRRQDTASDWRPAVVTDGAITSYIGVPQTHPFPLTTGTPTPGWHIRNRSPGPIVSPYLPAGFRQ